MVPVLLRSVAAPRRACRAVEHPSCHAVEHTVSQVLRASVQGVMCVLVQRGSLGRTPSSTALVRGTLRAFRPSVAGLRHTFGRFQTSVAGLRHTFGRFQTSVAGLRHTFGCFETSVAALRLTFRHCELKHPLIFCEISALSSARRLERRGQPSQSPTCVGLPNRSSASPSDSPATAGLRESCPRLSRRRASERAVSTDGG